jgi:hypothetical protein
MFLSLPEMTGSVPASGSEATRTPQGALKRKVSSSFRHPQLRSKPQSAAVRKYLAARS